MATKKTGECIWCDKPIAYDGSVRLWKSPIGYYCTKDPNPDRCQHIPKS